MNECIFHIEKVRYEKPEFIPNINRFDEILKASTEYFGVSVIRMKSKGRERPTIFARQIAMTLMYMNCTSMTVTEIAGFFNRDHTTAGESLKNVYDKVNSPFEDIIKEAYPKIVQSLPFPCKPLTKTRRNEKYK